MRRALALDLAIALSLVVGCETERERSGPAAPAPVASPFLPTIENRAPPPGPSPAGMVWIPGGEFSMGADRADDSLCDHPGLTSDAQPIHRVRVDGFFMDATEVTNEQFGRFVEATGYVTIAERTPTRDEFPDASPEDLVAGSIVFTPTPAPVPLDDHFRWWRYQRGATWRHPEGPGSDLAGRERYPVVHVAYDDALAYAKWAGKRLPTEAEFEFAARGGLSGALYPWGNEMNPGGRAMANTYQGDFPTRDSAADGFAGVAEVGRYPPNGYGLYDVSGNVWEWVGDWYRADAYAQRTGIGAAAVDPHGPDDSHDPAEPGVPKRVHRGGSFLCTDAYCTRYMVGTRGKGEVSTATNHLGFRCVR